MKEEPLISIIMPAYNCEKYLEKAVESVKKQTYQNWELWIIEDFSTDSTRELVKKLAEEEKIYVLMNQENLGVSKSRNRGIMQANGEWIAFLDSDDLWTPHKLEKQVEFLQHHPDSRLVFTGSAYINELEKKAAYILHVPEKIGFKELLKQNVISCSSVLVERNKLLQYKMPGDYLHEDYSVWLRILLEGEVAYGIDEAYLIYRISSESKSGNKLNAAKMQWRTYRFVGVNFLQSCYYMIWYIVRNVKKYQAIKNAW